MKVERNLAPVDFSEYSATGLLQAAELADQFGAELIVQMTTFSHPAVLM